MIAAENLIEDAARTSRMATPENVLQDAPSIEGARGERILTRSPEESRDVLQQTAVVVAVESLLQGPGSSRRRGIARETADGPTAGRETVDPLEFLASVLTHLPDKGQGTQG